MQKINNLAAYALLFAGLIAWIAGSNIPSPSFAQERDQKKTGVAQKSAKPKKPRNWRYSESPDKMGRGVIKRASTRSLNTVSFDFPYQGAQHGELTLRIHPQYGKDIMFSIERGQFLTDIKGCKVLVRFDDGKPIPFWADEPADHSTTTIFIREYSEFMASLMQSKKVMIEAPFYQEGNQVFEFNVEGLEWEISDSKKVK